jgi:hypothetical protein
MIFDGLTRFASFNNTSILKMPQSPGKKRPRDAREPTLDSIELQTAGQQLAYDKRRPAIRKDLGRTRNGTVLVVSGGHAAFFREKSTPIQS